MRVGGPIQFDWRVASCALALVLTAGSAALAQSAPPPAAKSTQASARPAAAASSPGWNTLSTTQKKALRPLASHWDRLSGDQQRKWLALSANFGSMTPEEQSTLHSRMSQWAALSPQQRTLARLNFAETRKLPADERKAKWEAYQALPAEEKKRLGASAPPSPAGAAMAVRPVEPARLVPLPAARSGASAPIAGQVQRNTLLPRPAASRPRAPASVPAPAPTVPASAEPAAGGGAN